MITNDYYIFYLNLIYMHVIINKYSYIFKSKMNYYNNSTVFIIIK